MGKSAPTGSNIKLLKTDVITTKLTGSIPASVKTPPPPKPAKK